MKWNLLPSYIQDIPPSVWVQIRWYNWLERWGQKSLWRPMGSWKTHYHEPARGVGGLGVREQRGRSPFLSLFGYTVADAVPSQSRFSLPTMSGSTVTAASVDTVWPGGSEESVVGKLTQVTQVLGAVIVESGEEYLTLAVLLIRTGFRKVHSSKLSREGRLNPIPPRTQEECGWVFTEEMLQGVRWVKIFPRDKKSVKKSTQLRRLDMQSKCLHAFLWGAWNQCHYQSTCHLRQHQRYRGIYFPEVVRVKMLVCCMVSVWQLNVEFSWTMRYLKWIIKVPFLWCGWREAIHSQDCVRIQLQLLTNFVCGRTTLDVGWSGDPDQNFNWDFCVDFGFQLEPRAY